MSSIEENRVPNCDAEPSAVAAERRASPRYLIQQRCVISVPEFSRPGWNCIAHNVSRTGIGALLPLPVQPGTVLRVEPWGLPGAPTLQVRVVHCRPFQFVWIIGCELSQPLSESELRLWRKTADFDEPIGNESLDEDAT